MLERYQKSNLQTARLGSTWLLQFTIKVYTNVLIQRQYFLITITSIYLWASEVFKNCSVKPIISVFTFTEAMNKETLVVFLFINQFVYQTYMI